MDWHHLTRANASFIPAIQLTFTGIVLGAIFFGGYTGWEWLIPVAVYFCTGCLGITMTFHRYLTHRSFEMSKPLEYLFTIFGCLGGTGSSVGWKSVHIDHHRYADTPKDPHSPFNGKLRVLFGGYHVDFNKWSVRDLINDPFHRFLHNYYNLILLGWAALLAMISFKALILGFIAPVALQLWVSNLSNCFNHLIGYRNFQTPAPDNSRNTWWLAILAWGEGWHNLHHQFPWCARFGIRKWEIDVTYWMIRLFGRNPRLLQAVHTSKLL
jgi:stearoyl-CoA desaturase (delta-9 desaturase)